jgi:hypothetical protein
MDFQAIENFIVHFLLPILVFLFVFYLIVKRTIKTIKRFISSKQILKKSKSLDQKKFNGITLANKLYTQKQRLTNTFDALSKRKKRSVSNYLTYKTKELEAIINSIYGGVIKRSNKKIKIIILKDNKIIGKLIIKNTIENIIHFCNKYHCLNELIIFFHHLPTAILESSEYEIEVPTTDYIITYQIK